MCNKIISKKLRYSPNIKSVVNQIDLKKISEMLKKGDNKVLEPIFKENRSYCIKKLLYKNCTLEEAEDIFVEAIINIREKLIAGKINDFSKVKAYLANTCINMYLKRLQQNERWKKQIPDVERFYYESAYYIDEDDNTANLSIAQRALNSLGEKCKDIIHFYYIDKLKMSEIASLMGLANSDVAKNTKARCYKKLLNEARIIEGNLKEKNDA